MYNYQYKKNIRFVTVKYKKVTILYFQKKGRGGGEAKKQFRKNFENKKIILRICKNRIGILSFFLIMNNDTASLFLYFMVKNEMIFSDRVQNEKG